MVLVMKYIVLILIILLCACAPPSKEPYPPKWVIASQYLPTEKLKGLQQAGFFEIGDSIYSHHCDRAGNMIRMKYDEGGKLWTQVKYETHGCI